MDKPGLYFIALIPHHDLLDEIRELKEEMKVVTGARDILKSPAHITLQKPFKRELSQECKIISSLKHFCEGESPFKVELDGFGSFPPRVIYIRVGDHRPLENLHSRLKECLINELSFTSPDIMNDIHPHITLTTRYLTREGFNAAWPLFRERIFTESFEADSISLLRHDGKRWEILHRFRFGQKQ